jgi:hypothetical protein
MPAEPTKPVKTSGISLHGRLDAHGDARPRALAMLLVAGDGQEGPERSDASAGRGRSEALIRRP